MAFSQTFIDTLDKMKEVHLKKGEDYASNDNPYENFERAALIMSWFKNDIDKIFVGLIAVKLARLATLLNSGKSPQNESIADTFVDFPNYSILWGSFHNDKTPSIAQKD